MDTNWLNEMERAAWLRLLAVVELLPGVLEQQLRRDAGLSHFEYFVLTRLSEADDRTLRMNVLARRTNSTLARLSHVVRRLETHDLIQRRPCPTDGRATNATLTEKGWHAVESAAPDHLAAVRRNVVDALTAEQLLQLRDICDVLLPHLDRSGSLTDLYDDPH
ncbi:MULTISPECIES: MarR family winged helix-turn-helix transcriptional regulator [Nocardiaceae]|jgi:DNA-binding MarR family transcriptional regulator|uniref:MarR family winged helix-turn-helix transcriptional regulator n=1 Tax=Nocardiaceae TaxID=85025 RepID=UPI000560466F|nr:MULTISPECIES: MarR family transcriptional regulator [Rhodococcus]OZE95449.1 MarR family transcriptional regulator [Rhodococcus sp. 15-1189-1-1a]OZF10079.1 MarR family transcriptional regulator [Rhodococcus sp. 14-2686-1-2]OZF44945.1 MarR family transcriptional regulator [Rhodococcus sp. 14-2470-1b]